MHHTFHSVINILSCHVSGHRYCWMSPKYIVFSHNILYTRLSKYEKNIRIYSELVGDEYLTQIRRILKYVGQKSSSRLNFKKLFPVFPHMFETWPNYRDFHKINRFKNWKDEKIEKKEKAKEDEMKEVKEKWKMKPFVKSLYVVACSRILAYKILLYVFWRWKKKNCWTLKYGNCSKEINFGTRQTSRH